jgi:hypothetical protein
MPIESLEQAQKVVREADLLKGDDYSEEGLQKQVRYIEEQLGPQPSVQEKELLLRAITSFSS